MPSSVSGTQLLLNLNKTTGTLQGEESSRGLRLLFCPQLNLSCLDAALASHLVLSWGEDDGRLRSLARKVTLHPYKSETESGKLRMQFWPGSPSFLISVVQSQNVNIVLLQLG